MKIYLQTYGCTANKADASLMKGILKENKHEIVNDIDKSETIIVLTCTVIDTTEQKILSYLKKIKEKNKKIIVAGCMASVQQDKIKKILPDTVFLPPQYSHHINDIIEGKNVIFKEENKTSFTKHFDSITAPISISEGCMFSCSYCITSLARGKLKSFPISEIKKDVCHAINMRCKEIQITSQDTSSYGFDIGKDLGVLLKSIVEIEGDYRIRVGMMNPYTCMKKIDSIISGYENDKIYKFLHLPVQSGDNLILEKMTRKYTVEEFENIINRFRDKFPNITVSTDIIVGFPSETEEQFHNTITLLKKIKPDITNITRFSPRPYTAAKKMKNRISTEIMKQRSKILTELCYNISLEKNREHIGKKYDILITEKGKNNTFVGRSRNYKPVVIKDKVEIGEIIPVEIVDAKQNYLVGSII